jgi:glycosyltransferase involved in cell wall biosynthesis
MRRRGLPLPCLDTSNKANVYAMLRRPLRIVFTVPAYWPAVAYGGPVWITRDLAEALAARGHEVDVVTTTLRNLAGERLPGGTREIGGVRVHYVATPVRYRWMGWPRGLSSVLSALPRPDVVHLIGYRDPLGLRTSSWARAHGVPYLLEPMGMFRPRVRKLRLKRVLDPLWPLPAARRAALLVADATTERNDLIEAGVAPGRIALRPSPFPAFRPERTRTLRDRLGLGDEPLVLNVGRIATGKGIEVVIDAVRGLPGVHFALVGPSDHAAMAAEIERLARDPALAGRLHVLGPFGDERPLALYGDADVFVLASLERNENFGMVVAEAVAAGTPVVVSEHAGIAELVADRAGLVVPPNVDAVRCAIARVLEDGDLRSRLRGGAAQVAGQYSAAAMAELQEEIYMRVLER